MKLQLSLREYDRSRRVQDWKTQIPLEPGVWKCSLGAGICTVQVHLRRDGTCLCGEAEFLFHRPTALAAAVAVELVLENWKKENYVFIPGAVYNGNRFSCQHLAYPPYAQIPVSEALTHPPVIADIPHLSDTEPVSRLELCAGDMTTPAIGSFDGEKGKGILLLTKHISHGDYTGISFYEDLDASHGTFALSCPAVREQTRYLFGMRADGTGFFPHTDAVSDDTGCWFRSGETVCVPFAIDVFEAQDLNDFFAHFSQKRDLLERGEPDSAVPCGAAYQAVKEKFQRENYIREQSGGYYGVGVRRDVPQQCWQAGWIGGGMNYYAFLLEDKDLARERGLESFRFIFDRLQNRNGWVCGMYRNGIYYDDSFDLTQPGNILLIRKNADLLYFAVKEFMACREELAPYERNLRALADAFHRLFRKYGQIGQFIDIETEQIVVGNSAAGAMAPAALALCYTALADEKYLHTAKSLAALYEEDYLNKGIVNGGPGEICQAPDSESAFALLESFAQLYETTGEYRWLKAAQASYELAMTWVMNYNFHFPQDRPAAKRGIHTTGTVFANAQNKHSAPGICTLSGSSLLKLYRFTGQIRYLESLRNIVRGLMQCVSLEQRPVFCLEKAYLPVGYVSERCQTSDWEGKGTVGEFFYGSNWPETSVLLTYAEVPGIYVDRGKKRAYALDAVTCELEEDSLRIENCTAYETVVTVLVDNPAQLEELTCNYYYKMRKVPLLPGERVEIKL